MRFATPFVGILALLMQLASTAAASAAATTDQQPAVYPPGSSYRQIAQDMQSARERALREDKLILYVMGADWCHDSVDFVEKTQSDGFAALIEERYVLQLINVGNLEFIREVINRYGEPVIYGTPTALVVEPQTDTLLNRDSLPYWRSSALISAEDTLTYFQSFTPGQSPAAQPPRSAELAQALAEIDRFERQQAERIYLAYADLGDLMRAEDGGSPTSEFMVKWKNLAAMRSQITDDLVALRNSAVSQDAAGTRPIALEYPSYSLYLDEPSH